MTRPIAALLICVSALAQTHQHVPEGAPPVDLAALPKPVTIAGIGTSHITVTTQSAKTQEWFDQGLALLHCFWDYEALRAFEESVRLDADCAMCHWGIARALRIRGGQKDLAKAELDKAKDLSAKASDQEKRYIRADVAAEGKTGEEGEKEFAKEMEALIERYPDDIEAKLLYALTLNHGYDEKADPKPGTVYGQAALRELLRQHPENAAANHYWIHAVEVSNHPEWAVESAEKLGKLAPGSGHMVHMPGHIFFRIGDYERARQIFLAAMQVDAEYMARAHVTVANDWNYVHNISYLIADCAEEGRYAEAREHSKAIARAADDPDRSGNAFFYVLQIGTSEARLAIRYGRWDDVIGHPLNFGVPDERLNVWARSYRLGLLAYARGMKAAEAQQPAAADRQSALLDAVLWRLSQEEVDEANTSPRDRALKLLGTGSLELRGAVAGARGDLDTARKLLTQADEAEKKVGYSEPPQYARPALEVLAAIYLRSRKFDEARATYATVLKARPHSGFALYGMAQAWQNEGKSAEAAAAYREFLAAWSHADDDLPMVKTARSYLAEANPTAERR